MTILRMTPAAARDFRLQLQHARENALKDAEAFDEIIHVIERLGSFCLGKVEGLGRYQCELVEIALTSPLAEQIPGAWRSVHVPFERLYSMIKDARNDALHIGAAARHLTTHAVEAALILEDALRMLEQSKYISDYMVRDPVCAHLWQPVSLIRQRMLTNSFSYLPVADEQGRWRLVSDLQVAKFLQGHSNSERKRRLAAPLSAAGEIKLESAICLHELTPVAEAMTQFDGRPLLVVRKNAPGDLVGILTTFDLL